MSLLHNSNAIDAGVYNIERSLRFNSADSAYLSRTPSSSSNRRTWTWSGWVKRTTLSSTGTLFSAGASGGANVYVLQTVGDKLAIRFDQESSGDVTTTPVFRDPSAWYHVVIAVDTTQATASNRVKIYVNNLQITAFDISSYPSQNFDTAMNNNVAHQIGLRGYQPDLYLNSYLTEIHLIDGQALTPSSFGETDTATGVWKPKAYTSTYGTNGFFLKFADNSGTTAATLGKDSSGNGNNWTPNNFSVTAGSGNDSMVDTPTSYGTDTGAGGEVRGNYCTLNPLDNPNTTYAGAQNGNLEANLGTGVVTFLAGTVSTLGGKYYWEFTPTIIGNGLCLGITYGTTTYGDANNKTISYIFTGDKRIFGADTAYGSSYAANDVIGVAIDSIASTIEFFKNNTSQGVITNSSISLQPFRPFVFNASSSANSYTICNFGQRPFAYTAPSGFKALCTQNLPTPTIGATASTQAGKFFNVSTWSANVVNPTAGQKTITVGFQPDLVWSKNRDNAEHHYLMDVVRGDNAGDKWLKSNATAVEGADAIGSTTAKYVFGSNGFDIVDTNSNSGEVYYNAGSASTPRTYVGWAWKANGAGVTNNSGTITSTVSASTTSGFSIVTYTSTTGTVGHGLGVAPVMIIMKARSLTDQWTVGHQSINGGSSPWNYGLALQATSAQDANSGFWNNTAPTPTVFSQGSWNNGQTKVAYCFAPIAGYSAFGSYTGNGSSDGPFVFTGFRPRWILTKNSSAASHWYIYDAVRNTFNVVDKLLYPNLINAEDTHTFGDILSNGFKIRSTDGGMNGSGNTIVYAAFAEFPFKYTLAR